MKAFEYARPSSVEEAVGLLSSGPGDARVLAGGTDLLSLMKSFVETPGRVVSLAGVDGLRSIRLTRGGMEIGATATLDELLANNEIASRHPALVQAAAGIHSPQLRAVGTVGGELLQRPRCWYYRRGLGLLATDDKGSLVERGDNRYHAVIANQGPAKFVSPSSLAPALIALGATATVHGPKGKRTVKVAELYRVPESEQESEFTLGADEILVSVLVPEGSPNNATYEVRHRQGLDWPLATASVMLQLAAGSKVRDLTAVLGHVAPTPVDVSAAVKSELVGKELGEDELDAAARAAVDAAVPLSRNGYKIDLARVAMRRALQAAR